MLYLYIHMSRDGNGQGRDTTLLIFFSEILTCTCMCENASRFSVDTFYPYPQGIVSESVLNQCDSV